jgi:hypothetical protein
VSQVFLDLAKLQIEERHREMDRMALARLARPERTDTPTSNLIRRIARTRNRVVARLA